MRPSRAGFSNANKCPRSFTAERSDANLLSFLVKMYFLSYGYGTRGRYYARGVRFYAVEGKVKRPLYFLN